MCPTEYDNDELIFAEEDDSEQEHSEPSLGQWQVLVVDDDSEIHSVTKLALSDLILNGKKLVFHHAYSGEEAIKFLRLHGENIAIILLDVVMETDDAGLQVAKAMRQELQLEEPRIILRTGQPGYAPEERVIKEYDINDYKTKTELTRSKLITTIIASLRSYQQILTIDKNRKDLQRVIDSATSLSIQRSVRDFCEGAIKQVGYLLEQPSEGMFCGYASRAGKSDSGNAVILAAVGSHSDATQSPLASIHNDEIAERVKTCLESKQHYYGEQNLALYVHSPDRPAVIYFQQQRVIGNEQRQLLEVFLSGVVIGYENVNLMHKLRNAAYRDWLTKLPNRNEFVNMLDRLHVASAELLDTVALIDIRHFSDVNDGLGQEAGNLLLVAVAERLRSFCADRAKLARIGADVYGIIGMSNLVTAENINGVFALPFQTGDHALPITVAIGICRFSPETPGLNVLKQSNIALNHAKKTLTRNYEFYSSDMEEKTTWRLQMIRKLRSDFSKRRLQVWYQPQIDLNSEKIVGLEALLRWSTAEGEYIPPSVFVPLAEYSGLIIEIGEWVLEEACGKLRRLNNLGFDHIRLSVNISMPQFRDPHFLDTIKTVIAQQRVSPSNLELEITESLVMDEPQIVVEALRDLKMSGIQVAIDDFGTGFSSMSYLQQLPLDRLKLDRTFVKEVALGKSALIAETIVTLGQKLGLRTIAEGVENQEQANFMSKIGCDEAQGYLYAKPMPYEQLLEFLYRHQPATSVLATRQPH